MTKTDPSRSRFHFNILQLVYYCIKNVITEGFKIPFVKT